MVRSPTDAGMLSLTEGGYRLLAEPARGGSIHAFEWQGQALMRTTCGPSILDTASFPLVPFSNRIAEGRFTSGDRHFTLPPNFPNLRQVHPIHGYGWLAPWAVEEMDHRSVLLVHRYGGKDWPWPYEAQQRLELSGEGLRVSLTLTNRGWSPMPGGLGLHPYFVRSETTRYLGLHRGEWHNDAECLPERLTQRAVPADWWNGCPVGARRVDTVYTERYGPLSIRWPDRQLELTITPSDNLSFTVVYTPAEADFFCVEPVSHMTDAVNRDQSVSGLVYLEPGASMSAQVNFSACRLANESAEQKSS